MDDIATDSRAGADGRPWPSLREALAVWARVALLSFGGPAGQIAVMHRILVEEKRWLGEARFLHALNRHLLHAATRPGGPAARHLYRLADARRPRRLHGRAAVRPAGRRRDHGAERRLCALGGNVGTVAALFFGLKAAVLAIVVQAVVRIGSRALRNRAMMALAVASFVAIFFFAASFPLIVLTAAVIGYVRAVAAAWRPSRRTAGTALSGAQPVADAATILGDAAPTRDRRGKRRLFLTPGERVD